MNDLCLLGCGNIRVGRWCRIEWFKHPGRSLGLQFDSYSSPLAVNYNPAETDVNGEATLAGKDYMDYYLMFFYY